MKNNTNKNIVTAFITAVMMLMAFSFTAFAAEEIGPGIGLKPYTETVAETACVEEVGPGLGLEEKIAAAEAAMENDGSMESASRGQEDADASTSEGDAPAEGAESVIADDASYEETSHMEEPAPATTEQPVIETEDVQDPATAVETASVADETAEGNVSANASGEASVSVPENETETAPAVAQTGNAVHIDMENWHPDFSGMHEKSRLLLEMTAKSKDIYINENFGSIDNMADAAKEMNEEILRETGDSVWTNIYTDDVMNEWKDAHVSYITFNKPGLHNRLTDMDAEINGNPDIEAFLSSVLAESGITEGMTKTDAVQRIASWFAANMSYDSEYRDAAIADTAKTHHGVCYQQAKLFKYACDVCGIDCKYMRGTVGAKDHAWNVVTTEAGRSYADMAGVTAFKSNEYLWMNDAKLGRLGYVPETAVL